MTTFVCNERSEKVSILKYTNSKNEKQKVRFSYLIEPVLGVDREYTKKHIVEKYDKNKIVLLNRYNECYGDNKVYIKIVQENYNY